MIELVIGAAAIAAVAVWHLKRLALVLEQYCSEVVLPLTHCCIGRFNSETLLVRATIVFF